MTTHDQFGYSLEPTVTAKRVEQSVSRINALRDKDKINGNEAEVLTSARQLIVTLAAGYVPPADDDELEAVAKAIHDGPNAKLELEAMGNKAHSWESCPHKKTYRGDARAVLAAGFRRVGPVTDDEVEAAAIASAKAANADYWVQDIIDWEAQEDWERAAQPQECPNIAYEDRDEFRASARAALEAARAVSST